VPRRWRLTVIVRAVHAREGGTIERNNVEPFVFFACIVGTANIRRPPIAALATSTRETNPIGLRRRMHGVAARLPQRADVRNDVGLVVHAPGGIFLGDRQLAGRSRRTLRSRLAWNPFEIVELALQPVDPRQ